MNASLIPRPRTAPEASVLVPPAESVLIVGVDDARRDMVRDAVERGGWHPILAVDAAAARSALDVAMPSLVVLTATLFDPPDLELLDALRADGRGGGVPVVVVLARRDPPLTLEAFGRRADDVIVAPITTAELVARLRVRLDRPPRTGPQPIIEPISESRSVPISEPVTEPLAEAITEPLAEAITEPLAEPITQPVTGALSPGAFAHQVDLEIERVARGGRPGALAFVALHELPGLQARLGNRARDELLAQVVALTAADGRQLDVVGFSRGLLVLLLPATPAKGAQVRLERLSRKLRAGELRVAGRLIRLTPVIGYTMIESGVARDVLEDRAWAAMTYEGDQLDLHPTRWQPAMSARAVDHGRARRVFERFRTQLQVAFQQLVCLGIPFGTYVALDGFGIDISGAAYLLLVVALTLTAAMIWAECLAALRPTEPPPAPPGQAPPPATAVIAAYLPNEAETIVETVEAFLAQDYPDLQVILSYNTPRPMEVEERLREIAARDPRFEPLRVEGSVSKAQNVNAALPRVRGWFVGMFDADHHPQAGSFLRAWRWLAGGADVVQGHCVVRNGDQNWLTRLVAAEFEVIYAVSHPGRARLHGFGIFGGSNGYWRAALLEETRMRGFMLTEDIDSSLRVVRGGGRIVSDPGLVSTELCPDTPSALWNQRMRWSQGWSQVSLRHLRGMARRFGLRRRLGAIHLLGWRELYPWISLQVGPLFAFWFVRGEPPVNWFVPVFVVTTLFTMSVGPAQAWFGWRLAHPSIKANTRWFWLYLLASTIAYTEVKNIIARTAHVKEAMRERTWKVTPRAARHVADGVVTDAAPSAPPTHHPDPDHDHQLGTGRRDPQADPVPQPATRREPALAEAGTARS